MSELRQNLATKEWYVIATERAKRPEDFKKEKTQRDEAEYSPKCPFCPGNEPDPRDDTYIYEENGKWLVRSVTNLFSAFIPKGTRERVADGIYRRMNAYGMNEVIVESPLHNDNFVKMPVTQIEQIVRTYLNRYNYAMSNRRIEVVMLFKNYGPAAGCSQAHPHSQMAAVPVVPTAMRNRLDQAKRYYDDRGHCVYCVMMEDEMERAERIIYQNDSFVVFCPFASGAPFETWIMPKRHTPNFGEINEKEIVDLSFAMKELFSRYYYGLEDPDFNFVVRTPPRDETNDRSMHWYIMAMPRLTKLAGFEIGTGMFINVTLPEANAKFLREIKLPS